ncbi:MAG: hypothetical protein ACK46M_20255 [Planctomyces sp.]
MPQKDSGNRRDDRTRQAISALRRGADLSDELLVSTSQNQGCHQFATFDTAIVKRQTKVEETIPFGFR